MTPGDDIVLGQVWRFQPEHLPETLRVLDEIEDYRGSDDDLYKRVVIDCVIEDDHVQAQTYHYAAELSEANRVRPVGNVCVWPTPERSG